MDEGYLAWLDSAPLSTATRETYVRRLKAFLNWLWDRHGLTYDRLLTRSDFARYGYFYRQYLALNDFKTNSVNTTMIAIEKYMCFRALGKLDSWRREKPEDAAPKSLTKEELASFLLVVESSTSLRNKTLVLLLLHTGLRLGEVVALRFGDVKVCRTRGTLTVRCGKGLKRREVPLSKSVRGILLEYIPFLQAELVKRFGAEPNDPNQPFWLGQYGKSFSPRCADRVVRNLGRVARLKVSVHVLRHTFLSRAVRSGIDLVMVADWAGHSQLETTRRYARPTLEEKAAEIERLNIDIVTRSSGPPRLVERARRRSRSSA